MVGIKSDLEIFFVRFDGMYFRMILNVFVFWVVSVFFFNGFVFCWIWNFFKVWIFWGCKFICVIMGILELISVLIIFVCLVFFLSFIVWYCVFFRILFVCFIVLVILRWLEGNGRLMMIRVWFIVCLIIFVW